jgi:diacylglycerol kinase (ATP)
MPNKKTGIARLLAAMVYSVKGLTAAFKNEAAFRQECWLLLAAIFVAVQLKVTPVSQILLIGSIVLVLIVELLNSAIEAVVDRIGPEQHDLAGRAKDMGSAAVLVTLLLAAFIWIFILWSNWPVLSMASRAI